MLRILIPPTGEPISLAEAKLALRVDHGAEDDLIAGHIRAARELAEAQTGLALLTRTVRETSDVWRLDAHGAQPLSLAPVSSLAAVRVGGVALDGVSTDGARLIFATPPPAPIPALNGIEIDYVAGFSAAASAVPESLRQAIGLIVAALYEGRTGEARIPEAARALMAAHQRVRL